MLNTSNLLLASAGVALITLGAVDKAEAITTIDTTPTWDGFSIGPFGELENSSGTGLRGISSFGQTFTVGTDNVLTDFSLFLMNTRGVENIDIAGYVRAWNSSTNSATGPILYQSQPVTVSEPTSFVSFPGRGFQFGEFTFDTGGITLSSRSQYVAFISILGLAEPPYATTSAGQLNNVYEAGYFVFQQYGSISSLNQQTIEQATNAPWFRHSNPVFGTDDAAFRASFVSQNVSVPEGNLIGGVLVFTLLGAVAELKKRIQKV